MIFNISYLKQLRILSSFWTISDSHLFNKFFTLHKLSVGAIKLEATKFRPREVVRHVLQTAATISLQKMLTLEGNIADDIPIEVCNTSTLSCYQDKCRIMYT
jgi:hypothetical protein